MRKDIPVMLFLCLLVVPAFAIPTYDYDNVTIMCVQNPSVAPRIHDNIFPSPWWESSTLPTTCQLDFGSQGGKTISNYTINGGNQGGGYYIRTWEIWGGNTNTSSMTLLDAQTAQNTFDTTKIYNSFTQSGNISSYRYYVIKAITGNGPYADIAEWRLYGEPPSGGDTTPPNSITGLTNDTSKCEEVRFSWTNPTNSDYAYLYTLKDNVFYANQTNTTTSVNFTAVIGSTTFSSKTVDLSGNMNQTWVNQTATATTCPTPTPTPTPSFTVTPVPPVAGAQWCGLQDIFFQHDGSDIAGYENWINYPSGNPEVDENVTLTDSNWYLIDSYVTPANLPNVNLIQAGLRTYYLYASASTSAGTNTINVTVFKRNASGGETKLYSVESGDVDVDTVTLYTIPYASSVNLTLDSTDRLVAKVYVKKTTAGDVQFHWYYQGTAHASYVRSGFFVCAPSTCCTSPTPDQGIALPYVNNPTTDTKWDWWGAVTKWWWLPLLIIFLIWLVGRR